MDQEPDGTERVAPSPQVKVLFAGQDIDRSPFRVNVSKAMGDPTRVQARGPGLQQTGNVAGKPTYFDIYTAGNGNVWKEVRATRSLAEVRSQLVQGVWWLSPHLHASVTDTIRLVQEDSSFWFLTRPS